MATVYKTPGVYVEEIPKFPPSIAPVETAIPAFIGYTEKAQNIKPDDLLNVPTRIGSIAEYEAMFGGGAQPVITNVLLDASKNFKSAEVSNQFYMYDSLRLFYANGGGDCYIVSAGTYYSAGRVAADFTDNAIPALEKVDEPTILAFPDNSLLTNLTGYYDVYQAALDQCEELKDRVGLFDVKKDDSQGIDFRNSIGINNLKYGAVYSPWLEANTPKSVTYRSFKNVIKIGSSSYKLIELTTDDDVKKRIKDYDTVIADVDKIDTASKALANPGKTLKDRFAALESAYLGGKTVPKFTELMNFLYDIARSLDTLVGTGAGAVGDAGLKQSLLFVITSTLKADYTTLIGYDKELDDKVGPYEVQFSTGTPPAAAEWGDIFGAGEPADSTVITAANFSDMMDQVLALLRPLFDNINEAWLKGVTAMAQAAEQPRHKGLLDVFPLYKNIVTGIQNTATAVPPCGAVAGIYAYTDRTRGVWKAPANVSISNVVGPTETFIARELEALNVDPNAGKSVNAIRSFLGKGTLVFGARTLAGNDNEWRYVSVRRFFNFVEESVKKATEQFVFEPNDANTWVKIQAMIENFLTTLWRQGALQGVKPEHAFYVAVGLGKTMTPLDILEGRLYVEIGMAAVRPAEFIILKFSHKMAES